MSNIILPQRPPQENLLQHTFDKYGHDIVDGVVPSSVGDKSRLPQPGRGYSITDPTSLLRFTDLTGVIITSFEGTTTPTISGNDIAFTVGILYSLTLSNGAFFNCEDTGLIAFDSSGNGNHGTKVNTDVLGANTFSYEGDDVPKSYQNEVGYSDGDGSDNNGLYIPRDESNPKFDVLGNPLQYKGQASYPAKLVESNCLSFDGVDDLLRFTDLTGVTITSYQGTAIPTINGNDIECTAGTLFDLLLSDGTHLPCAEGAGNTVFDASGNNNHGTLINGVSWDKQDVYHYNYESGFKVIPIMDSTSSFDYGVNIDDLAKAENTYFEIKFKYLSSGMSLHAGSRGVLTFSTNSIRISDSNVRIRPSASSPVIVYYTQGTLVTGNTYILRIESSSAGVYSIFINGVLNGMTTIHPSEGTIPIGLLGYNLASTTTGRYQIDLEYVDINGQKLVSNDFGIPVNDEYPSPLVLDRVESEPYIAQSHRYMPLSFTVDTSLLPYLAEVRPSQRNHNGAETKIDFNPYNSPALSELNVPYAIDDDYRNQLNQFKRDNSDILFYKEDLTGSKLLKTKNYTKEL